MKFVIVSEKKWNREMPVSLRAKLGGEWYLINKKQDFNEAYIKRLNPDKIFIPHWSYYIPDNIYEKFECIVFHMTDLPYGRGGSPLQNLIVRGHKTTKISALRVTKELDEGDIYLKYPLDLSGTAQQIFLKANEIVSAMIEKIVKEDISPKAQEGNPTMFNRRKPEESNIAGLSNLEEVYDYVRMLDAEGYPNAFIQTEFLKFEFSDAQINKDNITAHVRITKKY